MKQNQKKRFNNGRFNNRNQQKQITRNTVFDSTGPCGKLRGTPLQLVEKYQAGAKDALMQNDIVLAQTCMQFADHYIRLQNQAIQNEQRGNPNNNRANREVEMQNDELPVIQMPSDGEGREDKVSEEVEQESPVVSDEVKVLVAEGVEETINKTQTDGVEALKPFSNQVPLKGGAGKEKKSPKAEAKTEAKPESKAKIVVVKVKRKVKSLDSQEDKVETGGEAVLAGSTEALQA